MKYLFLITIFVLGITAELVLPTIPEGFKSISADDAEFRSLFDYYRLETSTQIESIHPECNDNFVQQKYIKFQVAASRKSNEFPGFKDYFAVFVLNRDHCQLPVVFNLRNVGSSGCFVGPCVVAKIEIEFGREVC